MSSLSEVPLIKLGDVKMSYDILTIALILYCAVMFVFAILYLND
jgi:hypothetical protein